jgi:hypothetical protein
MWLGVFDEVEFLDDGLDMMSLLFCFSGCAYRGLMAEHKKSRQAGAERTGHSRKLGETSGGTDFLLERSGGDFSLTSEWSRGAPECLDKEFIWPAMSGKN